MPETPAQSVTPAPRTELGYDQRPSRWRTVRLRLRLWTRGTFSRDSLLSSLRSLAWVVPLTVLVWVYAEREQVATQTNFGFTVDVRSTDPTRLVTLKSPAGGLMHADLKGPQGGIDEVRKWLDSGSVNLDVDHNFEPGDHPISADVLNNQPRLKQAGVSISNCMPTELLVHIDALVERDGVKISASPDDLKRLGAPPVFTPDRVRISAPRTVVDRARANGQELTVYADFHQFKEMAEEGKHTLSSVPLVLSVGMDNANVKIVPPTVSAQIEVRRSDTEYTLGVVGVFASYPQNEKADKYKAEYPSTINNITVVGPPEEIERLKQQGLTQGYQASFFITGQDLSTPTAAHEAKVKIDLPAGVRPKDGDPTIKFQLVPRPGVDQ